MASVRGNTKSAPACTTTWPRNTSNSISCSVTPETGVGRILGSYSVEEPRQAEILLIDNCPALAVARGRGQAATTTTHLPGLQGDGCNHFLRMSHTEPRSRIRLVQRRAHRCCKPLLIICVRLLRGRRGNDARGDAGLPNVRSENERRCAQY